MADSNTFVLREVFSKIVAPVMGQTVNLTATTQDIKKADTAKERLYKARKEFGMLLDFDVEIKEADGSYTLKMVVDDKAIWNYEKLWKFVSDHPQGWTERVCSSQGESALNK